MIITGRNKRFQAAVLMPACLLAVICILPAPALTQAVTHVIHISVDGLRPDAVASLGPGLCPAFHRLMVEGAFTLNARTDCDYTNTLPNHTCQLTGRNVLGPAGHGISFNSDTSATIEEIHGSYVAGVFDVTHDGGFETALFTGKTKFGIFDNSWDDDSGAPDTDGPDDGRDKIDTYLYMSNSSSLVDSFLSLLGRSHPGFAFLHLAEPDGVGHTYGWESAEYRDAVIRMDLFIGMIISAVDNDPALAASTSIIVTADHGGTGTGHSDATEPLNYTVQFHAWGPGIPSGADIYELNPLSRQDPGTERIPCGDAPPVRNGDAANAATSLLGLSPVTGSTIGDPAGLLLSSPGPLPSVNVTSPSAGSQFGPADAILIEADVLTSVDISTVEFFADWSKIGEDTEAPYEFLWDDLPLGSHDIAVRAVNIDGLGATAMIRVEVVSTTSDELQDPGRWDAPRAYPNPSGSNPSIYMYTAAPGQVDITIFDAAGRETGRRVLMSPARGRHAFEIDMRGFPSGIYFFRAVSGKEVRSGKFVLIR